MRSEKAGRAGHNTTHVLRKLLTIKLTDPAPIGGNLSGICALDDLNVLQIAYGKTGDRLRIERRARQSEDVGLAARTFPDYHLARAQRLACGARSIPAQTRERVFEAARKFNYRPNYFARSLRQSRSMSIAVLAPDLSEGYFTVVMNGVQAALVEAHYFYFTASHYWDPELIREYPRRMIERAVDGFLLLNTQADFLSPLPVVAISGHAPTAGVSNLVLDHTKAAELALSHLRDLGHTRIAMMKGPEIIPDSEYRWSAILDVSRRYGIETGPELLDESARLQRLARIRLSAGQRTAQPHQGLHRHLLLQRHRRNRRNARPERRRNLRVPEDVSVIGFDDILGASYHTPSITTVRQPLEEMGRAGRKSPARTHRPPRRRLRTRDRLSAAIDRPGIDRPGTPLTEPEPVAQRGMLSCLSCRFGVNSLSFFASPRLSPSLPLLCLHLETSPASSPHRSRCSKGASAFSSRL
jgi:DNA-binding LacI/PurR family transcriptional regulator